jgi:iron complex outermembrane receptor protein
VFLLFFLFFFHDRPSAALPESGTSSPDTLKTMSVEELMDLGVTSVSKRPEPLWAAASAVQVVTQDDIRESGATSIPEALRLATNLEVAQVDSNDWAISARGFNNTTSNKMLVLIDGRSVYTPLYAGVFWDVQDTLLEDVDRVEVISGPGATQWGANAVNGVINVRTKGAEETQGLLLLGGGGSELHGIAGARYGGTIGDELAYRVYGKYSDRDASVLASGADAGDDWHLGQGGFRVDWNRSDGDRLTVQGDAYDGSEAQLGAADIAVSGGNVLGRWSRPTSAASHLTVQAYCDRTHRVIPGVFGEDLDTYDFDLQHHVHVSDRDELVWGLGYRRSDDDIRNGPTLAFLPARVTREWFSGFVQSEIAIVPGRMRAMLGTRIGHNDYSGWELQPGARLAWTVGERQTLWAAISRAVRTPSRIDRELFVPGTSPFLLEGGPDFTSEKELAYELGYRAQARARLFLSVAAYFSDYDDIRSIEPASEANPIPYEIANGKRGTSYGVEIAADHRPLESWHLRYGYTNGHVDIERKPDSLDPTPGSSEAHDPEQQLFVRSSWTVGELDLAAALRFISRIEDQGVPGYGEMDLRAAWNISRSLELALVGRNLLHDHHAEFGAPSTGREIERAVYGKATWRY